MSFSETIFLFFLALIIFGPKKLPEIARTVGKALNEFKRASNEFKAQIEQEINHLEVETKPTILPPSPAPDGTTSRALMSATTTAAQVEATISDAPAVTQAVVEDEPLFASAADAKIAATPEAPAAETIPASDEVTSASPQESHA